MNGIMTGVINGVKKSREVGERQAMMGLNRLRGVVLSGIFLMMGLNVAECDAALPWQMMLQDPATPIAEGIYTFHQDLMAILVGVCAFVRWMIARCVYHFEHTVHP